MSPLAHDDLAQVGALLTTARLGRTHEHHQQIGSTNDRALEWLTGGAPDGALVTADAQTAGRGRLGRPWSSPPGRDIYASVVLRPGAPSAAFGSLALAVGVGLCEGLCAVFGDQLPTLALKWPNDLLLDERKLAGILCESRWRGREVELVIGFGLNVHREAAQFEPGLQATATSLAQHLESHQRVGRAAILAALLHQLELALERFFAGGFAAIRSRYESRCIMIGREIQVEQGEGQRIAAIAIGLDDDGALRAQPREGGPSFRVQSADVWLA
ncbi:Biotin--protein ligase [Enhygromyxa salina]|uniref:biotin--[biotin carboxyl-carrier protein] ligase n=1 Tax=Enhygromyxa salina TaxID=215803 RepID=A0A0C1ZI95_9BACT|nr:biotin--[acetyl-CoA-carboxylase] ligase [Enhygromyxa salina]KIG17264.1 Biotin--protein ligase [Enhygromyxa salina]